MLYVGPLRVVAETEFEVRGRGIKVKNTNERYIHAKLFFAVSVSAMFIG